MELEGKVAAATGARHETGNRMDSIQRDRLRSAIATLPCLRHDRMPRSTTITADQGLGRKCSTRCSVSGRTHVARTVRSRCQPRIAVAPTAEGRTDG
jgi:hypothetical protein